ncbi:HEAT repeat-containing protein 4 [Lepisosteus oculatus]|uniref:HEAT repeat-containing protein 4 n=1 Tax=Lepisosteus oculatus TaxID=7918 RepID=UPI00372068CB
MPDTMDPVLFSKPPVTTPGLKHLRQERLYLQFLHRISSGLTFTQDVVKERGPDTLSYSQMDFSRLFDASGLLTTTAKLKNHTSHKRATPRQLPVCSSGCAEELSKSSLTGPKNTYTISTLPPELPSLFPTELPPSLHSVSELSTVQRTDSCLLQSNQSEALNVSKKVKGKRKANVSGSLKKTVSDDCISSSSKWDEFVLKKLTKTTAQWIVSQQMPGQSANKARLQDLLKQHYGSASATDLVCDEPMNMEDFRRYHDLPKEEPKEQIVDGTHPETPLPLYYRVPGFCLLPTQPDEPGGNNWTADNVKVRHLEPPQPPRLQDRLNPRAGRYVYHTDNSFEQELYSEISRQVHQHDGRQRDRIIMDNNSEYQKHLQDRFPRGPEEWSKIGAGIRPPKRTAILKPEKGARRWVSLPSPADYAMERGLQPPDYSGQDTILPGTLRKQPQSCPPQERHALRYMVEEWRKAWKLMTRWQNVTIEGLKRNLSDLHYHVRIIAIATCASGAVNRPSMGQESTATAPFWRPRDVQVVPEELQPLLLSALEDPSDRVRLAAALCQYVMGTANRQARNILHSVLQQDLAGVGADSWAAAQCLALEGDTSIAVIQRLLSQLYEGEAHSDREQATVLLASLSKSTTLVRSLLAEKLNSGNWRDRAVSCNTIAGLSGPINKDIANKLVFLMWNDWNRNVRLAAARALGKMELGKEVHNELRKKLEEAPPSWRVEALSLLAQLEIMTAKLLPAFLCCLSDDYAAVRKQACQTAAALGIKDEMVLNHLIHLMQTDPLWEVRVRAISALGKIGCLTPAVQEHLLWALHHEEEPRVRIATCDAIKALCVSGPELQHFLQERLILEANPEVQRKIADVLRTYGCSLNNDKDTICKIKEQVDKLCTKGVITQKVLMLEELEETHMQQKRHLDLASDPGRQFTHTDMARLLEDSYTEHHNPQPTTLPPDSRQSTDETKTQSFSDTFRSSSPATGDSITTPQGHLSIEFHV